jgi:hypothetical protein
VLDASSAEYLLSDFSSVFSPSVCVKNFRFDVVLVAEVCTEFVQFWREVAFLFQEAGKNVASLVVPVGGEVLVRSLLRDGVTNIGVKALSLNCDDRRSGF